MYPNSERRTYKWRDYEIKRGLIRGLSYRPEDFALMAVKKTPFSCWNEYGTIKSVIVCSPRYIKHRLGRHPHFNNENISEVKALGNHDGLVRVLRENGIDVILLEPQKEYPEQLFTRDIGFVVGEKMFVSNMKEPLRQGEERNLKKWLHEHNYPFIELEEGTIEGGDVIVDGNAVWVGDSGRTQRRAIEELQSHLPHHDVLKVPFEDEHLHLDCIFNIISETEAIIYPGAFHKDDLERFASKYALLEIVAEEVPSLAPNVFSIGNKRIISITENERLNAELKRRDYDVMEVGYSEVIKAGGSIRCTTLPLRRE